mmetsp:Transcript_136897/g.237884  ORF Transcript_136897/g.237884 Transcript_136897/m.237884 type:complete len:419 (-) Transcript_136897:202-1458(-)
MDHLCDDMEHKSARHTLVAIVSTTAIVGLLVGIANVSTTPTTYYTSLSQPISQPAVVSQSATDVYYVTSKAPYVAEQDVRHVYLTPEAKRTNERRSTFGMSMPSSMPVQSTSTGLFSKMTSSVSLLTIFASACYAIFRFWPRLSSDETHRLPTEYGAMQMIMATTSGTEDENLVKDVGIMVNSLKREAWVPFTEERTPNMVTISQFGGMPVLRKDESWPKCGKCQKKMRLFLQLDLEDVPPSMSATLGKEGVLQVFVCGTDENVECITDYKGATTCPAPNDKLGYLVRVVNKVDVQPAGMSEMGTETFDAAAITYWHPVEDYPKTVEELVSVYPHLATSTKLSAWDGTATVWGDKIGGWPMWTKGQGYVDCPDCECTMNAVLQLDSDGNLDFSWGNGGAAHVHRCSQCGKMSLTWNDR